ncbi:hypothetical protein LWI29_033048 [Acer saccharum]|uniref:Uncharacterized protein n=1 Tax=Acer saccharum TaxID=4024 RepID=A0AA39VWH7_ACESA|nr:hypothetical protein LWI29_033048 [Acer saccharum]
MNWFMSQPSCLYTANSGKKDVQAIRFFTIWMVDPVRSSSSVDNTTGPPSLFKMVNSIRKRRKTGGAQTIPDQGGTQSTIGVNLKLDNVVWINYQLMD